MKEEFDMYIEGRIGGWDDCKDKVIALLEREGVDAAIIEKIKSPEFQY